MDSMEQFRKFCGNMPLMDNRPIYQMSVYRSIGPLVYGELTKTALRNSPYTLLSLLTVIRLTIYEPRYEKTNVLVSDLVPHKPGCTATEDG